MTKYYKGNELIEEIEKADTAKGKDIKFTFWQTSDNKAHLVCMIGHGLGIPVFYVWEIELEDESPHDLVKEAQKLKAYVKRHFKDRNVTSDLRY